MSDRNLRVLLLWQGGEAQKIVKYLEEEFLAWWNRDARTTAGEIAFHQVARQPGAADQTFLTTVEKLMAGCDCAIAIQAAEGRPASSGAGNLWLEVGFWLALRGSAGLYLLQMRSSDPSVPVEEPSDIEAFQINRFDSESELRDPLARWLREAAPQRRGASEELPASLARVRATFGPSFAKWAGEHFALCRGSRWESSAEILVFIAELLRMGRSARELADLSSQLLRVSQRALDLSMLDDKGDAPQPLLPILISLGVDQLRKEIRELWKVAAELLHRPEYEPERKPGHERLKAFLKFRIEALEAAGGRLSSTMSCREVDAFIEMGVDFSSTEGKFLKNLQSPVELRKPMFVEVLRFCNDARTLARFIDDVRSRWFEVTRERMKAHFKKAIALGGSAGVGSPEEALRSLQSAIDSLAELSRQLPHNNDSEWPIRIWSDGPARRKQGPEGVTA